MKILYNTIEVPVPNTLSRILSKNKGLFSIIITTLIIIIVLLILFLCFYARRFYIDFINIYITR